MKHLLLIATFFMIGTLVAQNGTLSGKITTLEGSNQEEVPFVIVRAIESNIGAKANLFGEFTLVLPAGKHSIAFLPSLLEKDTVIVEIKAGETTILNKELFSSSLMTVVVMGKAKVNEVGAVYNAKVTKEDTKVTTNKTAKQIEEGGDSDLGAGAKKMTGMSTVGEVLYVRGLGDRYNVAYLNGLPLPSPNPDFRVVPLSIFPTDIVSSVSVSKVMSAELYGDFSGGAFNIITKSYLDKPTLSFSFGSGMNTQTTFKYRR